MWNSKIRNHTNVHPVQGLNNWPNFEAKFRIIILQFSPLFYLIFHLSPNFLTTEIQNCQHSIKTRFRIKIDKYFIQLAVVSGCSFCSVDAHCVLFRRNGSKRFTCSHTQWPTYIDASKEANKCLEKGLKSD